MPVKPDTLPVQRACELEQTTPEQQWLIDQLWAEQAVGIIGGSPKCCKSWFGLEMAVSVASGTDCLGRFAVAHAGPTLVYLAEDALAHVRARIEQLCRHRGIDVTGLALYVITAPSLRLDLHADQQRLEATLASLKPRLLLLDPLVRLHQLDENSAADIARLLGFIRRLQRAHQTAIALVHHASKKHRAQPGQALRGSSDLHAFGDSNAYLARQAESLTLTLEHRCAQPPKPLRLQLVSHHNAVHLAVLPDCATTPQDLSDRIVTVLNQAAKPINRQTLRSCLKVNNQRLGEALEVLQKQGRILRTTEGYLTHVPNKAKLNVAEKNKRIEQQPSLF